jgi:addiction module RelB/DinJ family antitoxin
MNANINIRTTSELKSRATQVLQSMGLDMSTAVNLFLTQVVYKNAIPFEISAPPAKSESAITHNGLKVNPAARLGGWEGKVTVPDGMNVPIENPVEPQTK